MTDPISDMLTQIRNAAAVRKAEVVLPFSALKHGLANLLEKQGLLAKVQAVEPESGKAGKVLKLELKYSPEGECAISGLSRLSKPGRRMYAKLTDIQRMRLRGGITVISTSKGLMTDKEARKEKIGGEVICQIW